MAVRNGTPEPDTLIGTDPGPNRTGADTIRGFGKEDTLYGLGGNDTIFGGDDKDLIYGGDGG